MDVEPQRPRQLERSLEQGLAARSVAAPERASARGGESLARALGQLRVRLAELRLVASRLLEVVAEDLVQLDESRPRSSSQSAKRSCSSARVALGRAS